MIFHVVRAGETLSSIAAAYGTSVSRLVLDNGLPNAERLVVGQCIVIAYARVVHTVLPGESVSSIAARYGVSRNAIYRNNPELYGLPDISEGQTLVILFEDTPLGNYITGGYAYPSISRELLAESMPFMGMVMPFTYGFEPDGGLVALDDEEILTSAITYGAKPFMHLSTLTAEGVFSDSLAADFLNNDGVWETLAENILNNMNAKGYVGLDVDFEFLPAEDALRYAEFVAYMREKLSPYGYEVMVALAPKTADDQPGLLYEGHNYAALGEAADSVLVMTYEWGYTYGPPGAVSPIPSMRRVLDYAVSRIPRQKIFMGISNYGYDWRLPYIKGETRADSISTDTAITLALQNRAEIQYDMFAKAPYFFYTDNDGTVHEVWFEDARSIAAKLYLCADYALKGGLLWNLDRRSRQTLLMLNLLFLGRR